MSDTERYELYYSRADQRIYWVNCGTNKVEEFWECRNGIEPGFNEYGEPRASLPVKTKR